jgi:two-component system LytT family sensor kinase
MQKIRLTTIATQIVIWLTFWGYTLLFFLQNTSNGVLGVLSSPFYWLFNIIYTLLFYCHTYYLVPHLFLKRKYAQYFVSIFLIFTGFYLLKPFLIMTIAVIQQVDPFIGYKILFFDIVGIFAFFMVVVFGFAIQLNRKLRKNERQKLQAEAEKATAELSFLKAQINPHFLYNTLNNIYSLAVDHDSEIADPIMKLSNMMRYITDYATEDFVSLESEVAAISDYIGLQRLHHTKNLNLDFSVTGNTQQKNIAPLILMTYVENVFKYGISNQEPALITIKLFSDAQKITFFCQNKIFPAPRLTERAGIGLVNTQQRLIHLYPDKHTLNITNENGFYTVMLTVQA